MALTKKLGIFPKDIILDKKGNLNAKDYFCTLCLKENKNVPAKKFYSPEKDTQKIPYCNPCIDYLRTKTIME